MSLERKPGWISTDMSIFDSINQPKKKGVWSPYNLPFHSTYDAYNSQAEPSKGDLIKAYEDCTYACVSLIAANICIVPIRLYVRTPTGTRKPKCATVPVESKCFEAVRRKAMGTDVQEVIDHPILDLLNKCNAYHNHLDLSELTQIYLDLTGNSFWYMQKNLHGIPEQLYLLPSQNVYPERDENYFIKGWYFGQGAEQKYYNLDEVIHFKYANPRDPYGEGISPLRGAWQRRVIGSKELAYLDNMLTNQARPDGILAIKDSVGAFEAERLAKEWTTRFSTHGEGGLLVTDGTMNYQPINYAPKDLAELQLYQVIRNTISNCFHIPPEIWELGESNRATADTAEYLLALRCLKPRLEKMVTRLNGELLPAFNRPGLGDGRFFLAADPVVPQDKEYEKNLWQMLLQTGVATRAMAQKKFGLEVEEWAKEPLLPSGSVPAFATESEQAPSVPSQDTPIKETPVSPEQAPAAASNDLRATVGGSVAVADLQRSYYRRELPREACVGNAVLIFGFSEQEAARLFPELMPNAPQQPEQTPATPEGPKAKCGGEGGTPGPCPEPGGDQPSTGDHAKRQAKVANTFHGIIDRNKGLSEAQKAEYKASTTKVISKMTPKALDHFSKNVKKAHYHESNAALTDSLAKTSPTVSKMQVEARDKGKTLQLGGCYNRETQTLELDGGKFASTSYPTSELHAHEFTHAIDGPDHALSNSNEWYHAFNDELSKGQLSAYGAKSPAEGLAEAGRLAYGSDVKEADFKAKFPKVHAFFKKQGIL